MSKRTITVEIDVPRGTPTKELNEAMALLAHTVWAATNQMAEMLGLEGSVWTDDGNAAQKVWSSVRSMDWVNT